MDASQAEPEAEPIARAGVYPHVVVELYAVDTYSRTSHTATGVQAGKSV
jgi:hypothetical protein